MLANHTTVALTRRDLLLGAMITGAALVSGCSGNAESGSSAGSHAGDGGAGTVNVGTMVTEDFLPGWAAERDGLFGTDAQVNIITFQSAQELAAAMTSGDIDLAMTDPQVSAVLTAGGTSTWPGSRSAPRPTRGALASRWARTRRSRAWSNWQARVSAWAPTPYPST